MNFIVLGIDHPYSVVADETPSLLPDGAVAVRFHSIGGWGAITTGKNLGAILGDLNDLLFERDGLKDDLGNPKEVIHVSANPKYGSEKKGAPTSYFMVAAKDRIRVNCDLRHVTVVLCCDPKAFTHTNPLDGMQEGGCLVWESDVDGEHAWENLPIWARKQIIQKKIRVFTLPGFEIARKATDRADLQLRMQGNAFLGAFFAVSPMLQEFGITQEQYRDVVFKQYVKKFGKLGDAVVKSNMEVMIQGFERVKEIAIGDVAAADHSSLRGQALLPILAQAPAFVEVGAGAVPGMRRSTPPPAGQGPRTPVSSINVFDAEFRSHFGYNQPATPLSAMGVIAAATGDTASKYVARRETPLYIPENCTQCMECISVCPDTALPNCSQDLSTLLGTAVTRYVADPVERRKMLDKLPEIDKLTRQRMVAEIKTGTPLPTIIREVTESGGRLLGRSQGAVLRDHRQGADGLSEGERHLLVAGAQDARFGRHLLDLCERPVQGLRGLRHGLRRPQGAEDGAGDRRSERRARNRHRLPQSAARHRAEVSWPLQRRQSGGLKDRHTAQHADGADELRRAGCRRRRLRRLRRKERAALDCCRHRGVHAPRLPRQERPLCGRRPATSKRTARLAWQPSRKAARRSTTACARPSRTW